MVDNRSQTKITKYRKPLNLNIGIIIFGVLLIYIIICVIMYTKTEHLSGYEVKEGSLSINNVYRGLAVRNEKLVQSDSAGYIYYFTSEGEHIACGDLVYAVDSSGVLSNDLYLNESSDSYSDSELNSFKNRINNFKSNFSIEDFSTTYDLQFQLKNEVSKLNHSIMLDVMNNATGANGITKSYGAEAGTVVYSKDGYENLLPQSITEEHFNEENYVKSQLASGDLIGKGDVAYKLIDAEDWCVVIVVDKLRASELEELGYVKIRFLADQYETWGKVDLLGFTADGESQFVCLTFTNSMLNYSSERFLDIELITEVKKGLKIPNTAIAERNFFLVDKDYITLGINGQEGVIRQAFTENNELTTEFVETTVYNIDNDVYYLDENVLNVGDIIYKPDSQETYTISKQASLVGVYNINKGYADFKQIIILYQNDEYSIVESNTKYGLNCYDYIALNAETVVDNQFIYE